MPLFLVRSIVQFFVQFQLIEVLISTLEIFRDFFFSASLFPTFFFFLAISGKYEKVYGLVTSISGNKGNKKSRENK